MRYRSKIIKGHRVRSNLYCNCNYSALKQEWWEFTEVIEYGVKTCITWQINMSKTSSKLTRLITSSSTTAPQKSQNWYWLLKFWDYIYRYWHIYEYLRLIHIQTFSRPMSKWAMRHWLFNSCMILSCISVIYHLSLIQ